MKKFLGWVKSVVWPWAKPIIQEAAEKLLKEITPGLQAFARNVVIELKTADLSNEDKRATAIASIKAQAQKEGNELANSTISALVETVYNLVK